MLLNHDQVNFFFQYERYSIQLEIVKLKNSRNHGVYSTGGYPGSGSMTLLGVSYSFPDGRQVPHRVTTRSMLPVTIYTPVWRDTKQGAEFLFQEKKRNDKLKTQTHRTLAPADLEDE